MKYDGSVYERAEKELAARRSKAEKERERHHREVVEKFPEIAELERQMAICGLEAAKAIGMNKEKSAEFIETLKNHNLAAQKRRAEILKEAGFPSDYLEVKYSCPVCNDKGYIGGRMCLCYKNLIRTIAYDKLSRISPLTVSTFEDFKLDYYPQVPLENGVVPRRLMAGNYRYCKNYAENFSLNSPSLILYGATGLGKTHLSLAIAGEVINKGFGVIYGSAQNLLNRLENEKFGRSGQDGDTMSLLLECDLLILDDLGAEFSTSFTLSAIYNIINSRMLASLPTIISTNLEPGELDKKYDQRIASRILGSFTPVYFCGRDIRQLKIK